MFRLNVPVVIRAKEQLTGAFSRNVTKLSISELKLVTDLFLSIYAAANWEATEKKNCTFSTHTCALETGMLS